MNNHINTLNALMQKDCLTPKEVKEGVVACFFNVNRSFVQRRRGDVPIDAIDSSLDQLIKTVFSEQAIDGEQPSLSQLMVAQQVLVEQTGFEAEPDLLEMHKKIIDGLFVLAKK